MRLLNTRTLDFEEFTDNAVPQYAILSHTWGEDEVTLQDFSHPDVLLKAGYAKIKITCEEALKRDLSYAWVDTCCIDKTSSAELGQAINSMFRWYENAEVCFAFLVDVPPSQDPYDLDSTFCKSRWFTRGWTLQELLAPHRLDFFAQDWSFIGNRTELANCISGFTGIDQSYLREEIGKSRSALLARASIAQRMSWAAGRQTTRDEDVAYSLFGIFDVNMPLIYGEGKKAFLRLQEEIMRRSSDATLLAWNIPESDGQAPLPPVEYSATPFWLTVVLSAFAMRHPHSFEPVRGPAYPPPRGKLLTTGFLAPGPEYFHGCQDLVPCEAAFDWFISSLGINVTLPLSQDASPWLVLPCYRINDPWHLIALPLVRGSKTYSRMCTRVVLVHHAKWYQWPFETVLLSMKEGFSSLSTSAATLGHTENDPLSSSGVSLTASGDLDFALWIRNLPPGFRIIRGSEVGDWTASSVNGRYMTLKSGGRQQFRTESKPTDSYVLHITDNANSFAIRVGAPQKVRHARTSLYAMLNRLSNLLSSQGNGSNQLNLTFSPSSHDKAKYLDLNKSLYHAKISRQHVLDFPVYIIDIKQSSTPLGHQLQKLRHDLFPQLIQNINSITDNNTFQMATLLSLYAFLYLYCGSEDDVASASTYYPYFGFAILPVTNSITRLITNVLRVTAGYIIRNLFSENPLVDVIARAMYLVLAHFEVVCCAIISTTCAMQLIPFAEYLIPRHSPALRSRRRVLAVICGIALSMIEKRSGLFLWLQIFSIFVHWIRKSTAYNMSLTPLLLSTAFFVWLFSVFYYLSAALHDSSNPLGLNEESSRLFIGKDLRPKNHIATSLTLALCIEVMSGFSRHILKGLQSRTVGDFVFPLQRIGEAVFPLSALVLCFKALDVIVDILSQML